MRGKKEDLRHAEADSDPRVNFTYSELVEELRREHDYPAREEGDVTPREMEAVTNLTERQWYTILNRKVRDGEMVRVRVKEKGQAFTYFVYRKVKV
jgi:hypothetical protein